MLQGLVGLGKQQPGGGQLSRCHGDRAAEHIRQAGERFRQQSHGVAEGRCLVAFHHGFRPQEPGIGRRVADQLVDDLAPLLRGPLRVVPLERLGCAVHGDPVHLALGAAADALPDFDALPSSSVQNVSALEHSDHDGSPMNSATRAVA